MRLVPSTSRRQGLSLLEVLVALAVFLLALVALGTLVTMGGDRALVVDQTNLATQLCQSKMNEVLVGSIPINNSTSTAPLDDYPGWEWSMDSQSGNAAGLYTVRITVSRKGLDGNPVGVTLTQMVMDPSLKGNNGAYATTNTTNTNGSSNGSSGNSGGN